MGFETILIFILAIFFSINMGISNFAVSFAASYGGRVLSLRVSNILFSIFVVLGALTLGKYVTKTLSDEIIPKYLITTTTCLIIFISVSVSLFLANILKIPQSTSLLTVGALLGIGIYYGKIKFNTLILLLTMWILLPIISYILTFILGRFVYPPRKENFRIYEKITSHRHYFKAFIILASCYTAFSVGANNVANAVGPLVGSDLLSPIVGFLLISPFFGIGGFIFPKPIELVGKEIVPLGLLTATLVIFIAGSLIIIASILGIPQSFVMLKTLSIFAISSLKDGTGYAIRNKTIKKTIFIWLISPCIATLLSFTFIWGVECF